MTRFTRAERAADRAPEHAARGPALPESPALQHRAGRPRHAPQFSRRRPPRMRALPRSGALRDRRARTARLSTARSQLRVDRPARSRDLRLPAPRPMGIGGPLARPWSPRTPAGVRDAARARSQLRRSLCRLHRTRHRLRRRRCGEGDGQLRLAVRRNECLEGRTHAARLPAPADRDVRRAHETVKSVVSRVPQDARREAGVVSGPREVDRVTEGDLASW